jgi:hypothetical protein
MQNLCGGFRVDVTNSVSSLLGSAKHVNEHADKEFFNSGT